MEQTANKYSYILSIHIIRLYITYDSGKYDIRLYLFLQNVHPFRFESVGYLSFLDKGGSTFRTLCILPDFVEWSFHVRTTQMVYAQIVSVSYRYQKVENRS